MSKLLDIEIAGLPPSVNSMYRTGRNGNRYKKAEISEWQEEVSGEIRRAWSSERPYMGEVAVRVMFTVKGNRRWDLDNRLKALLDCLQAGGAIKDDAQIFGLIAGKYAGENSSTRLIMYKYTWLQVK